MALRMVRGNRPMCCDRAIIQRKDLTPAAKLVHAYYYDQTQNQEDGYSMPLRELAQRVGLSERQLMRAVNQLCRLGLLRIGEKLFAGDDLQLCMIGAALIEENEVAAINATK